MFGKAWESFKAMTPVEQAIAVLCGLAIVYVLFKILRVIFGHDGFDYSNMCLGGNCYSTDIKLQTLTPVDYAMKPNGWQTNPHYIADPSSHLQPLNYGPVDLYHDQRRLNAYDGLLFEQYRSDWTGCQDDRIKTWGGSVPTSF